jgi:hypothetical protein
MKQRHIFFKVKIQCLLEEVDNKPLDSMNTVYKQILKKNSVALVRERNIPTERPPPVGEVSANFCG